MNKKILFCSLALVMAGILVAFLAPNFAFAADNCKTTVLPSSWCNMSWGDFIKKLKAITKALSAGVTVLATVGMIICGFFWMTAKDNANQIATVKKRMVDIVIGLIIWIMFAAFIQFLLPDTSGVDDWLTTKADDVTRMEIDG